MWIDLNDADTNPFQKEYDVCVCGSGPAGMAVAQKLLASGARVLLLEAGGLEFTPQSQDVYQGESVGIEYWGIESCRLRYFGGTSNHWTGRCGLFDPIDFESREIWDLPGWPINHDEAYKNLAEAMDFLDLAPGSIKQKDTPEWAQRNFALAPVAMSPPTRVGEKFGPALKTNPNADVALNANVTGIILDDNRRRVTALKVQNYAGEIFEARAKHFVIAFGALENARFLLNANNQIEHGVGNQHDMVGRCFMEHFDITLGRFVITNKSFSDRGEAIELNPKAELMRKHRLSNAVLNLNPQGREDFYGRLAPLRRLRRDVTCSSDILLKAARNGGDIVCENDGIISTIMEQTPNKESRVTLNPESLDQFGNARLKLDWRLSAQDRSSILKMAKEIGKSLARQNLARLRIADEVLNPEEADLGMHCHQMGTTRMSASPKDGVVDGDAKVHGIDNLYIGGSSVFSTGGGINPTLTLTALAFRLGDHLRRKLTL